MQNLAGSLPQQAQPRVIESAAGKTGFSDVFYDLISVQYHGHHYDSLKAGHHYGQYVRDARNAGFDDMLARIRPRRPG